MEEFSTNEITFIHTRVKKALDKLQDSWEVKFKEGRELTIIRTVAEAIFNLPRKFGGN